MAAPRFIDSIKAISRPKTNFGPDPGEQLRQQALCVRALAPSRLRMHRPMLAASPSTTAHDDRPCKHLRRQAVTAQVRHRFSALRVIAQP